ncbi:MAG: hypothetical protein QXZ13_03510 [Candidatus Diapherotrites archaeon]
MSYEIPKNLRHEETIIFGLSLWKAFSLAIPLLLSFFIFTKTFLPIEAKITILISSFMIGIGFAFFDLKEKFFSILAFYLSKREIGFLDKEAEKFLGIKKVYENYVLMKDKRKICIIQVFPVNFSMLKEKEQKAIILNFRDFLNSLDYPIQIIAKSMPINLDEYFKKIEKNALKEGNFIYSAFKSHEEFIKGLIEKHQSNEKKFFIIIQAPNVKEPENEISEQLLAKTIQCSSKLNEVGIKARILEKSEIVDLFREYFENKPQIKSSELNLAEIIGC